MDRHNRWRWGVALLVAITPPAAFFFFVLDWKSAAGGVGLTLLSVIGAGLLLQRALRMQMGHARAEVAEAVRRLSGVKETTEIETVNIITLLQSIIRRSKEGSEEAEAVVAYFMGGGGQESASFGRSYVSRMLRENEAAVGTACSVFRAIGEINRTFAEHLTEIFQRIETIRGFISDIDNIAFQTRILALNAAIEAARAGEHGLGFSVVAEEVRRLADSSVTTAQKISTAVQGSMDIVNRLKESIDDRGNIGDYGIDRTEQELQASFDRFKQSIDNISEAIDVLTKNYKIISEDIERATISLQFQDVINQEIDTINRLMNDFKARFDTIFPSQREEGHGAGPIPEPLIPEKPKQVSRRLPRPKAESKPVPETEPEFEDNVEFF